MPDPTNSQAFGHAGWRDHQPPEPPFEAVRAVKTRPSCRHEKRHLPSGADRSRGWLLVVTLSLLAGAVLTILVPSATAAMISPPMPGQAGPPAVTGTSAAPDNGIPDDTGPPGQIDDQLNTWISRGLTALYDRRYREARDALVQAAAIDPHDKAVQEALAQADQALKLAQLDRLRQQASAAEKSGHWSTALTRHQAALDLDPYIRFALVGRQRILQRIAIGESVEFYLTQPAILFGDRHLHDAIQLLVDAKRIDPVDTELAARLKMLNQRVAVAQTPVRVTLTSDNRTEVTVYKVGRLGRFDTHALSLRPGAYTVIGSRDGYRDVRLTVHVDPDRPPRTVRVACEETIQP